jgi:hypothetical protein
VQEFSSNDDVAFGDVNLSQEQIRGNHNPGAGGWPTIRYFNQETGYEGAPYVKKTNDAMCTELGKNENMRAYVEEASGTGSCDANNGENCSEKESKFLAKWKLMPMDKVKAQVTRLNKMKDGKMTADLKKWIKQRLSILKQLHKPGHDEL